MENTLNKTRFFFTAIIIILGLILISLGLVLSVSYGAKSIPFFDVLKSLFGSENTIESQIIRDIRLPRAIASIIIGCFLASSGSILQGITRNPIASPSIMGVTQGAALAVAIYMAFHPVSGTLGKVLFSFVGASISAVLIFLLSLKKANINITRMILAGTALGMLFISLASLTALLTNNSKNLAFWIAGGLGGVTWESVMILALVGSIALTSAIAISPKVTALSLGDEIAIGFGEKPNRIRFVSLATIILLSGSAAAVGGNIGFVCLIVPQIARMCIGSDYRFVIPVSMVFGGVLLVYSDLLARIIAAPLEVPLGSITSLIGVPFLIYLVRRGDK